MKRTLIIVVGCFILRLGYLRQDAVCQMIAAFQTEGYLCGNLSPFILDQLAQDLHFHFHFHIHPVCFREQAQRRQ